MKPQISKIVSFLGESCSERTCFGTAMTSELEGHRANHVKSVPQIPNHALRHFSRRPVAGRALCTCPLGPNAVRRWPTHTDQCSLGDRLACPSGTYTALYQAQARPYPAARQPPKYVNMPHQSNDRRSHWQNVYRTKRVNAVSWYQPHLVVSLQLLTAAGMSVSSRLIDVGGGASTLVDDLLDRGLYDVSVLDVSDEALSLVRHRLGERADLVKWYAGDVLELALPAGGFDLWHDRAVMHFLTEPADASRYAQIAANAVTAGGHAVIAGFAPNGPTQCSGLHVARRSAEDIAALFAPAFALVQERTERHHTPSGSEQSFTYVLLQRR